MNVERAQIGQMEQADQVDRVLLEGILFGKPDATAVIEKIERAGDALGLAGETADHTVNQTRRGLCLLVLEFGAEDAGEIAHILGHQEVVLHKALDG